MRVIPIQGIVDRTKRYRDLLDSIKRIPSRLRTLPRLLGHRVLWTLDPRRRKVGTLLVQLAPLPGAPEQMQQLRQDIYARSMLDIKNHELRQEVQLILKHSAKPMGPEHIFLIAIYPILVHRRLVVIPRPSPEGRLDVEIGYRAHADEYYFWEFEIDGRERNRADRIPTPRTRTRDERIYLSYRIPAAGLVDVKEGNSVATILHVRSYLLNILNDLKRRGYQLLTARPHTTEVLTYNQRKLVNSRVVSPFAPRRYSRR